MKTIDITSENHDYIVQRYVDRIVSRMDNIDFYNTTKEYLYKEKLSYPYETLEQEIARHFPSLLEDHTVEQLIGKEREYAKNF